MCTLVFINILNIAGLCGIESIRKRAIIALLAAPPVYGYDCCRTYEMLLLGVIPIIFEDMGPESNGLLNGLPVVIMPKMRQATNRQECVDATHSYIASDKLQNVTL
jgi:hypothetical protein